VASDETAVREKAGPTRLTVRDAFLTATSDTHNPKRFYSLEELEQLLGEKLYTEVKTENALDRVTSEANPRPMERVPAGAAFEVEMIFDVYRPEDKKLLKQLFVAMRLLEHSALGGSGSRGHGKVEFADLGVEFRPIEYYRNGNGAKGIDKLPETLDKILEQFDRIDWKFPAFSESKAEPKEA
jgi:CRISPR-associated protein Csm3